MANATGVMKKIKAEVDSNPELITSRNSSKNKNSGSNEPKKFVKAIESRNFVAKTSKTEDKCKDEKLNTKQYKGKLEKHEENKPESTLSKSKRKKEHMVESNGSFVSRRTRAAKGLKLGTKLPVSSRELTKTTSKSIKDAVDSKSKPETIRRKNSRYTKGSNKKPKLESNVKVMSTICKSADTFHKSSKENDNSKRSNQNSINSPDELPKIASFEGAPADVENFTCKQSSGRKRGVLQSIPSSETNESCLDNKENLATSKVNVPKVKNLLTSTTREYIIEKSQKIEKVPKKNTTVQPKDMITRKSQKTPENTHEASSSSHRSQTKLSIGTVSRTGDRIKNKGQTKKLQLVNTISEKGDILKQRNLQGLKAEAIEQMLQEEDENDESYR